MSADNGIYILQSRDGFRVIHTQAIENLWYWETHNQIGINPKSLYEIYGRAKRFDTEDEVWNEARRLYKKIMSSEFPIIEYGISIIPGWEDKDFPSE